MMAKSFEEILHALNMMRTLEAVEQEGKICDEMET